MELRPATPAAQNFFCRLAVFAGEFDLDPATAVVGDGDDFATLDLLEALVDRSMVVPVEHGERLNYRVLETLRQYGGEHLGRAEREATGRRYAKHYSGVVAHCVGALGNNEDDVALAGLANSGTTCARRCTARETVHRALEAGDAELALRLIGMLSGYVWLVPDPEIADWATAALGLSGATSHPLALWVHLLLAHMAHARLDVYAAEIHAQTALDIIEQQGLRPMPRPYLTLGYALGFQGRFSEAIDAFRRAAYIALEQGRTMDLILALHDIIGFETMGGNRPHQEMCKNYPGSAAWLITRVPMRSSRRPKGWLHSKMEAPMRRSSLIAQQNWRLRTACSLLREYIAAGRA